MAELVEEHWKRGVQDRVYFRSPEGVQVGWLDLKTGREVLVDVTYKEAFDASVNVWALDHHNVRPRSTIDAVPAQRTS